MNGPSNSTILVSVRYKDLNFVLSMKSNTQLKYSFVIDLQVSLSNLMSCGQERSDESEAATIEKYQTGKRMI